MAWDARYPNETLVQFYNRRLDERGRHDIEWFEDTDGNLRLRSRHRPQSKFNFGDRP